MKSLVNWIGVGAVVATACIGTAQAEPLCQGMSRNERNACLQAEVNRGKRESEIANRRLERLDRAMKLACLADRAAPIGAGAVAKGGGLAYKAGRAIGDKITGQRPCK